MGAANRWVAPMGGPGSTSGEDTVPRMVPGVGPESRKAPSRPDPSWFEIEYAVATQAGTTRAGEAKQNQDSHFARFRFMGRDSVHLFGVLDEHGQNGAAASSMAAAVFPDALEAALGGMEKPNLMDPSMGPQTAQELLMPVAAAAKKACNATHDALTKSNVDFERSGTTLVAVLLAHSRLVTVSVGDSGAFAVSRDGELSPEGAAAGEVPPLFATALTAAHSPSAPSERQRILAHGGMVAPSSGLCSLHGQQRVWAPQLHFRGPGLAMSRSIGDGAATSVGVISDPLATFKDLRLGQDRWVVLASDGLTDVVGPEELARILEGRSASDASAAATALCRRARAAWRMHSGDFGHHTADDTTVLLLGVAPVHEPPGGGTSGGAVSPQCSGCG